MKIKDYIESGILEEFCMGVLDEKSEQKIILLAQKYPIIQREIDSIQETLYQFDKRNAIQPSINIKENLLSKITEKKATPVAELTKEIKPNIEKQVPLRKIKVLRYIAAAAITAFLFTAALSIYINNQLVELKAENASLKADLTESNELFASLQTKYLDYSNITQAKDYKQISLEGLGEHTDSFAYVFRGKESIYVSIANLPKPAPNKQYQFWAIIDGAPVSIGLIDPSVKSNELSELSNVPNATAFAISLEDIGGKASPTSDQIHVFGNVI